MLPNCHTISAVLHIVGRCCSLLQAAYSSQGVGRSPATEYLLLSCQDNREQPEGAQSGDSCPRQVAGGSRRAAAGPGAAGCRETDPAAEGVARGQASWDPSSPRFAAHSPMRDLDVLPACCACPSEGCEPHGVLLPDGSVAWLSRRRGQGGLAPRPARRPPPGATTRQPGRPRTRRRSGWTWTPSPRSRRPRAPSLRTTRPRCRRRGPSVRLLSQQHSFLQPKLRSNARVLSRAPRTVLDACCATQEDPG